MSRARDIAWRWPLFARSELWQAVAPPARPHLQSQRRTDLYRGDPDSRTRVNWRRRTHRRRRVGPLGTVDRYWRDIGAGRYAAAFHYIASGAIPQTQAQFVSDERQSQIASIDFHGQLVATTSSSATVTVSSLTTDDSQFGCRTWTGTYQLTNDGNRWLIARAAITPTSCSTPQPPPATSPSASADGGPGTTSDSTSVEAPGSTSHATDMEFCTTHACIPNFPDGNGYIVQCADGAWSHSGGLSGACSDHGENNDGLRHGARLSRSLASLQCVASRFAVDAIDDGVPGTAVVEV